MPAPANRDVIWSQVWQEEGVVSEGEGDLGSVMLGSVLSVSASTRQSIRLPDYEAKSQ